MSRLTDKLDKVGIHNDHNFVEHGNVYVYYRPGDTWFSSAWVIVRAGYQTDPDGHWQDRGNKTFIVFSPIKDYKPVALVEALQWASKRYGIEEWARTPFNSWADKELVKSRLKELKLKIKEIESHE